MDIRRFLAELKGRGVYRVAAIYAAGSWALLQVADIIFPIVGLPQWAITAVLGAAALGFPVAVVLAWLFDITPEGIVETDTEDFNHARLRLSPARLIELTLLLTLVFLVGFLYMDRLKPGRFAPDVASNGRASIAVMPFVNMSNDVEIEYFGDGLAEEILNLLAKLNELNVSARTSSFYFKDKDVDIQQIGERLGVEHVLEGSVRRSGDKVRVTAQLIHVEDGYHLWSETYDRDFKDTFLIQDEIARQVTDNLQVLLSVSSQQILEQRPTLVPEAYDFYLRGRDYLRSSLSDESVDSAIVLFTRAIELDETYAEAYAGLCDAYLDRYRAESDPRKFALARQACETALELDSQALPVYVALGNLYRHSGEYEAAIAQFGKALEINASAVDATLGLAETYQLDNKPQLAQEAFLSAISQQPNYWRAYLRMGSFLFASGRFEEAVPYYTRITDLMPDNAEALNDLGAAYYLMGDFAAAAQAMQRSLEVNPTALAYSNAGSSLFFLGRYSEAIDMYQKAVEYAPEDYQNWGSLADAYSYAEGLEELASPMYENAIKLASERLRVNSQDATTYALVAHYQARIGLRELALQNMSRAIALAPKDMYVYYNNALMLTTLGESELAIDSLKTVVELGYSTDLIKVDAGFKRLNSEENYLSLVSGASEP